VSKSILGMPTFRESCSPLHQDEKQPDTELFLQIVPFIYYATCWRRERRELRVRERSGGNWSVFNNWENGFPYFIYVIAIFFI